MSQYFRIWMPYVVKKMNDDAGGWIVLNRDYRLLGFNYRQDCRYEYVPRDQRIIRLTHQHQKKLAHTGLDGTGLRIDEEVYLYFDAEHPLRTQKAWDLYSNRLLVLSGLTCFEADR